MLKTKHAGDELNLFSSLPKDSSAIPTANHILYSWLIALVCAIALHASLLWQHDLIATESGIIKNELTTVFNRIASVAGYDEGGSNKMAGFVKPGSFVRHINAHEYFYSLARIKNDKAWLTSINLDFEKSELELVGVSSDSAAMYNLASAIKESKAYKHDKLGLENVKRNITSEKSSVYDFSLTSRQEAHARGKK